MIDSAARPGTQVRLLPPPFYNSDFIMANRMDIDARGFNGMIRQLKKMTGETSRPIVRAVTKDVLASAAKKTYKSSKEAIEASIAKKFRQPFEVPGVGFIGVTKAGKVWANLASWGDKSKWALLNTDGKLKNVPKKVRRTGLYKPGSETNLGAKNKAKINLMVKAAKEFKKKETKYRKSLGGLSKASWYYLMKTLKLPIPSSAPKYATSMKIPAGAKAALKAWESVGSKDNFAIILRNSVQACLNPRAKGIGAFRLALNGQVKNFRTRMAKDSKEYAKQFASKHGFTVK